MRSSQWFLRDYVAESMVRGVCVAVSVAHVDLCGRVSDS